MIDSDLGGRLSVSLVDVSEGREAEFHALSRDFEALFARKEYGRSEVIRDEGLQRRFYAVRRWKDAAAAEQCHADKEAQALTSPLYQIARITHVVNGVRKSNPARLMVDERRAGAENPTAGPDSIGAGPTWDGRKAIVARIATAGSVRAAARRAREHADAAFSNFKVGAALEAADGTVFAGCNIENATFGLGICAERVAMFKGLSEGHRVFTRIAIVADTETPAPPCGACRQILWEFGGDIGIELANLKRERGSYRLKDLLPMPFDARLL